MEPDETVGTTAPVVTTVSPGEGGGGLAGSALAGSVTRTRAWDCNESRGYAV